jgi:hypothetical protein
VGETSGALDHAYPLADKLEHPAAGAPS